MKSLIKKREMHTKGNRIYIQDSELKKSLFEPGTKFNVIFEKNKVKLVLEEKGKRTVSKRNRKTGVNPVIDVKSAEVLEKVSNFSKMELEIYEDEIILHGIVEGNCIADNVVSMAEAVSKKTKKKWESYRIPRKLIGDLYMKKAAGSGNAESFLYEQIAFDFNFGLGAGSSNISVNTMYEVKDEKEFSRNIKDSLRLVSLFSGMGVLDKGFIDNGFKPVWACELEKDMADTYAANLGNHIVNEDINNIDITEIPDAEVLIGGSPCQDFSNANRVTGKILDSPKNLLIRKYLEVAESMKSLKVFVLENVPQLLNKGKVFVDEIKERMAAKGFEITVNKVNSKDFGSAQSRERAIIIGSKIGPIKIEAPSIKLCKTVRQAFEGLTDETPNQLDFSKPKADTVLRMSYVPQGGNFLNIPTELRGKGTHSNSYKRLEWDSVSCTIANPRKSNIMPPEGNRSLSVRECCRLFDLPDTYKVLGTLSNKQQMIANAVPLNLAKAIAKAIKRQFEAFFESNSKMQYVLD